MIKLKNIEKYTDMLTQDGKPYILHEKRGSVSVLGSDFKIKAVLDRPNTVSQITSNKQLSKGKLLSIFATVKKSFIKKLTNDLKEGKVLECVPRRHTSKFTNRKLWKSLKVDRTFYYIDINHCYWRIAYQQGYISEYYYEKILESPEYKLYRNISLSSTIASSSRKYYDENGKLTLQVKEDATLFDRAYSNIRHTAWNLMGDIREEIGDDQCLKYMTDGMMVFKKKLKYVCARIEDADLTYKIMKCRKLNDIEIETVDLDTGEIEISKF